MNDPRAAILYAEDDLSLAFVTQDNLELAGFRVIHCTSGPEALEKFQRQSIDVCLLDVMLPEMDGFALAREIRRRNVQVPILFLTAKSLKEDRIVGFTLGGDDYVTKPFSNVLLPREAILMHLWQDDDYFAGRSLDVFISRLRKYLAADSNLRIENVHGVGFRFVVP